mgnify:CR=1 FL=1|jgi:hypothetical protein
MVLPVNLSVLAQVCGHYICILFSSTADNRIANFMEDEYMKQITRAQIQKSLDTYVKTYIADAEWHISLVEDFMHLLTGNSFNVTDLQDSRWIRTIIDNNKDNEYAKRILMRNMPETYISGLFNVVIRETNHVR